MPRRNLDGVRFSRLVVVCYGEAGSQFCRCDCGKFTTVSTGNLTNGHTQSCGCLRTDAATKHGMAESSEFWAWVNMIERCTKPNHPHFKDYGGRGIRVHQAWIGDFSAFYAHVGPKPGEKYSLDRADNNGNYEPGNVRWATGSQQAKNKRSTHWIEIDGERKTVCEWAEAKGLHFTTICHRISRGMTERDAVLAPPRLTGRRAGRNARRPT